MKSEHEIVMDAMRDILSHKEYRTADNLAEELVWHPEVDGEIDSGVIYEAVDRIDAYLRKEVCEGFGCRFWVGGLLGSSRCSKEISIGHLIKRDLDNNKGCNHFEP